MIRRGISWFNRGTLMLLRGDFLFGGLVGAGPDPDPDAPSLDFSVAANSQYIALLFGDL